MRCLASELLAAASRLLLQRPLCVDDGVFIISDPSVSRFVVSSRTQHKLFSATTSSFHASSRPPYVRTICMSASTIFEPSEDQPLNLPPSCVRLVCLALRSGCRNVETVQAARLYVPRRRDKPHMHAPTLQTRDSAVPPRRAPIAICPWRMRHQARLFLASRRICRIGSRLSLLRCSAESSTFRSRACCVCAVR